jgi:ADP-heptose:LPS heptosyltransferase
MYLLVTEKDCDAFFYGQKYSLRAFSPPRVDLHDILACEDFYGKFFLSRKEFYPTLKKVSFDVNLLPGMPKPLNIHPSDLAQGSKILVMKSGALGDILLLTPALKHLREAMPANAEIWLSIPKKFHILFEGSSFVDRLFAYPFRLSELIAADYYVLFESADFARMNIVDFYLHEFLLDHSTIKDKQPILPADLRRSAKILRAFNHIKQAGSGPTIFYNGKSNAKLRDLPERFLDLLLKNFPDITFVVTDASLENHYKKRGNIICLDTFDNMRDYITAIDCCDALVSADTSTYHVAAGLDKPGLVFFSSIDPGLRTGYYSDILSISPEYAGKICRSPCGLHSEKYYHPDHDLFKKLQEMAFRPSMDRCPEAQVQNTVMSPCLTSIPDESILENFKLLLSRVKNS